ncbi:hypothetical protein [Spirosoma endophyticum]|uniref:Uncharacterized protein n=1 Tax=Spirosoma endophyticum TaxID=662367 RepID=A0A1I2ADG3_9BACT|nr:hypothetical protein [Spirosoma endophyticum]SFE41588.1 hypothetical protein SAMN05216167_113143 [Spirosoma endophyticum]
MMSSEGLTDHHVEFYLFTITGYLYDVAQAAARKWGDETSPVVSLGLSGWIRSRALGWLTTSVAVAAGLIMTWLIS